MSLEIPPAEFRQRFERPQALLRDVPFWGWNGELNREQILRQIAVFHKMGMGGFFIHSRTGLSTEYLGEEYLDMVRLSIDEAKKYGLSVWLYDEDRYPSGYGGGRVTDHPEFVRRYLQITVDVPPAPDAAGGGREWLRCYQLKFDDGGRLCDYHLCAPDAAAAAGYRKMWCYRMLAAPSAWFNHHSYVDCLNPKATQRFLEVTHEVYRRAVGGDFGGAVPGIFTDEPCHGSFQLPKNAHATGDVAQLPFTDHLPVSYQDAYGADVFRTLPEVIWECAAGYSQARYRYHEHVARLFADGYSRVISGWCRAHKLKFCGHLLGENFLDSQTANTGDVMRHYPYFDLPGVDVLCDSVELTTVKQCQSICRQNGKSGMASELDGVTDWDFPFFCHKGHGDWQAALGVNVRIPHHALMSLAGEAKRDYPASIGEQSPWHEKYPLIADHFARVNVALSAGKPCCRIGVVHPIESYWLACGPQEETARLRRQMEDDFQQLTRYLLQGLLDFDFISESVLPDQTPHPHDGRAVVGQMAYRAILVPPCLTLRSSTVGFLKACAAHGVPVFWAGTAPQLVDAAAGATLKELLRDCPRLPFSRQAILDALEKFREIAVINRESNQPTDSLLYQMRELDDGSRILFISNTDRIGTPIDTIVRLSGSWRVVEMNTADGTFSRREATTDGPTTTLRHTFYPHGHLLLFLAPAGSGTENLFEPVAGHRTPEEEVRRTRVEGRTIPVTLSEPNVLPLDLARWRMSGDAAWRPQEEVLRIDREVRSRFALPVRQDVCAQPWCSVCSRQVVGMVSLCFTIECEFPAEECELAGEQLADWTGVLDRQPLEFRDCGYWCDQAIRRTRLPRLEAGTHELVLSRGYHAASTIEPFYLLGDFGVRLAADSGVLTRPVAALSWGDITQQGLPFFSGTILYHTTIELAESSYTHLRIPSRISGYGVPVEIRDNHATRDVPFSGFAGTLVSVVLDGEEKGDLVQAPFQLPLGPVACGRHALDLKLYTSRRNSLGALHQTFRSTLVGPDIWRQRGDAFCYEYRCYPNGILVAPILIQE